MMGTVATVGEEFPHATVGDATLRAFTPTWGRAHLPALSSIASITTGVTSQEIVDGSRAEKTNGTHLKTPD